MFLDKTMERNSPLIEYAVSAHQKGLILPDSFILDVDTFTENAEAILKEARKHSFTLYYMLKQVGRNPYLARILENMGYDGAVVVDFRESERMMESHLRIGNVGHLVQIPDALIDSVVSYGVENITIYSLEKARRINECAKASGKVQDILIRVYSPDDMIYPGQTAGFSMDHLEDTVRELESLTNLRINGITSFPCYLYDEKEDDIMPTNNLHTVLEAVRLLEQKGYGDLIINTPSTTSVTTIGKMVEHGGNCGEPGHGLSGTTPLHARRNQVERPAVVYLSEVSHNFERMAYAYGGGNYRRGHVRNALVGSSYNTMEKYKVSPPSDESIDYHFGLNKEAKVGESVIMAFRFQMFVSRSDLVLVEGLKRGNARIAGVYDSLGRRK